MKANRIVKIRNLWRKWSHLNSSPAGWMSDYELEKIAKRIPKRIAGSRFVADAILEK